MSDKINHDTAFLAIDHCIVFADFARKIALGFDEIAASSAFRPDHNQFVAFQLFKLSPYILFSPFRCWKWFNFNNIKCVAAILAINNPISPNVCVGKVILRFYRSAAIFAFRSCHNLFVAIQLFIECEPAEVILCKEP